jgi:hypothetical protein
MTTVIITVAITLLLRLWNIPVVRDRVFGWVKKLPRSMQFVAPVVLAMVAAACQGWIDGLRGSVLFERALADGGQIGAMAIGLWHTAKRLGPNGWKLLASAAPPKPPTAPN